METQYYLLYKEDDVYVMDDELFRDENYIELLPRRLCLIRSGKRGRYIHVNTNSVIGQFHFAFVGCRIEDVKSKIVRIDLDHPVVIPPKAPQPESDRGCNGLLLRIVMVTAVRGEKKEPPPVSGSNVGD